jgi:hypothetical protein
MAITPYETYHGSANRMFFASPAMFTVLLPQTRFPYNRSIEGNGDHNQLLISLLIKLGLTTPRDFDKNESGRRPNHAAMEMERNWVFAVDETRLFFIASQAQT